jgi:hypothetical protein
LASPLPVGNNAEHRGYGVQEKDLENHLPAGLLNSLTVPLIPHSAKGPIFLKHSTKQVYLFPPAAISHGYRMMKIQLHRVIVGERLVGNGGHSARQLPDKGEEGRKTRGVIAVREGLNIRVTACALGLEDLLSGEEGLGLSPKPVNNSTVIITV